MTHEQDQVLASYCQQIRNGIGYGYGLLLLVELIMETYSHFTPCEEETYSDYKQRKTESIMKILKRLEAEIWDSSLKVADKLAIVETIKYKI